MTIDVEDWYQSTIDETAELSTRFEPSTMKVLEALGRLGVRGTFFVLGLAAEKCPGVVKAIAAQGHEVQSHGYGHRLCWDLDEPALRQDLSRNKKMLEDMTGQEVYGYRAPCFSIDLRNLWALDVLAETGHRYDSSIFPLKTSRYGIDGFDPRPQVVTTPRGGRIIEAPVACFDLFGKRRPVGGGGYFRLWPFCVINHAWRQIDRAGRPGIVYMHPYEYDLSEMDSYKDTVGWKMRMHQGLGRKGFPRKLSRLLGRYRFGPMKDVLAELLKTL